jgi:hypothetical protein
MPLPKIDVPLYDLPLPSDKSKVIKYRPFTVKEKKLFLLVRESKDINEVIETIKQIIQNCVVSPQNMNVDEMPVVDIEQLFVHLAARSIGEVRELDFECQNIIEDGSDKIDKKCGAITKVSFNLLDADVETGEGQANNNVIALTDKIGIKMKYPTFSMAKVLDEEMKNAGDLLNIYIDCIEYVYDAEGIHYLKDEKREDIVSWFEGLGEKHFEKIQKFLEAAPKIVGKNTFKCHKCGYSEELKLQGIQDFFG